MVKSNIIHIINTDNSSFTLCGEDATSNDYTYDAEISNCESCRVARRIKIRWLNKDKIMTAKDVTR